MTSRTALMGGVAAAVVAGGCGGGSKPTTPVHTTKPVKSAPVYVAAPTLAAGLTQLLTRIANATAGPPRIKPVFPHPLPGEGVWKPTGPPVDGGPPVLVTTYRPELGSPEIVAYVAWFDHTRTELAYYPGAIEPPSVAVRGPTMVPHRQRWRLLATFSGGFTYAFGNNGSTDNGRMNEPLADGNTTLVGYRDGRVAIVRWSGAPNAGPDVAWARQSPGPIVWNGQLNPDLNDNPDSTQLGVHARRGLLRPAHRCRHRPSRQPPLRRRHQPDGDHPGTDPPAHRRGEGDGVRHQLRMAHAHHLQPPPRARPDDGRAPAAAVAHPLPRPRQP